MYSRRDQLSAGARRLWLLGLAGLLTIVALSLLPSRPLPVAARSSTPPIEAPTRLMRGAPLPGHAAGQTAVRAAPPHVADSPPDGIDLDVAFINRAPMYRSYCVVYPGGIPQLCPGTESEKRWPDPGEIVTFTAHIVNKGTQTSPPYDFEWEVDGLSTAGGSLPALAPGAEATTQLPWTWGHSIDGERVVDDHVVRFTVDPADAITETYETNNSLADRSNALGLHLAITPAMVAAYDIPWNPAFSYSAEDWLQRQIAAMNGALAGAIYPATPGGATERVRINRIELTATPPIYDGTADGGWFVDADYRLVSSGYDPVSDVDWALVHELSHQIGLIDLYNLDIARNSVLVKDPSGQPSNFAFTWPHAGLMGGGDTSPHYDPHLYSDHSAAATSTNKGYRRGYYGEYQYDLPAEIFLHLLDNAGNPAAGVEVALYQRTGDPDWTGAPAIDNLPEIVAVSGVDGHVPLPNRAVGAGASTRTGHTLADNPFGVIDVVGQRNRFLMRLTKGSHTEFHWLDITVFNLAYWQGHTLLYTLDIATHVPPPGSPEPPGPLTARVEGSVAHLCWTPSPDPAAIAYHIYRAAPPTFSYERIAADVSGFCLEHGYGESRVYGVTAVTADDRESGFAPFAWAPRLVNPTDVVLDAAGRRVILDPQNGYALIRQQADGRYWQNFGSPHFHLEYSDYLTVDDEGRLIFSHPGDWYDSRHSVRVADADATPLLEFGQRGAGPGEFETPTGVAVWGAPCTIEGPWSDDSETLLLLHFDNSFAGTQGEMATSIGATFLPGKYLAAVLIDQTDRLLYNAAGNINRESGAIEFWLRPTWYGYDGESYTFFEIGDGWFNRLRIMKDGANNLRFMVWDSTTEYGVAYHVGHWVVDQWHHIAATWSGTTITLFVDGEAVDSRNDARVPDSLGSTIYVGGNHFGTQQAEAMLDEFRISGVPRVGNSDSCTYRFIVADAGNHRLQAFDSLGQYVAEFGEFGNGPGQFNWPRGLAIDVNGRILVADSGNNRVQVIGFDGAAFTPVASYSPGLLDPHDVAIGPQGQIVIADTGHAQVKVLSSSGALVAIFDAPNDAYEGPFLSPRGVAVGSESDIVVADTGRQRVVTIVGALPSHDVFMPAMFRASATACVESISNGGFEGDYGWLLMDTAYPAGYSTTLARSGARSLRTGIYWPAQNVYSYSSARQTVTIPAGASYATLFAWLYTRLEPGTAVAEPAPPPLSGASGPGGVTFEADTQYVLLLDAVGQWLATIDLTRANERAWRMIQFDLAPYAGQTVGLHFGTFNDGLADVAAMYVDDVSLVTCATPP